MARHGSTTVIYEGTFISNQSLTLFDQIFIFRAVNTTVCEPEDYFEKSRERWHPHRKMLPQRGQQAQYIY